MGGTAFGVQHQRSMQKQRIFARDRRRAAIHEAGHLVVARWAGAQIVSAWIVQNDNPAPGEKTYAGRVQIAQIGGIAPHRRRMIGVAGAVAEHLGAGGLIEDLWPERLLDVGERLETCRL